MPCSLGLVSPSLSPASSSAPSPSVGVVSGGFFVFNRGVFDYLGDDPRTFLELEPLQKLARARYDTLLAQLRLKAAAGTLGEDDVLAINALLVP